MDIEKFKEIFKGLNIAYGKFIPSDTNDAGKLQGDNKIIRQPNGLPDKLWEDHLNGTNSLGIIPIDENNECRWGCIERWCTCLYVFHCPCESESRAI